MLQVEHDPHYDDATEGNEYVYIYLNIKIVSLFLMCLKKEGILRALIYYYLRQFDIHCYWILSQSMTHSAGLKMDKWCNK